MRFIESLLASSLPVIAEVKRRAADGTDLLGGRSVEQVVSLYSEVDAPCLSVVTGKWFGGDEHLLREVLSRTDKPVLQKDFLTRSSQLQRAAELGVSAVLLTATLLPASGLAKLVETSLSLGLTPFVEVVTSAEIASVPYTAQCVIAVNNKDIKAKEQDAGSLNRSLALLPDALAAGTPCAVSASGIDTPRDAALLLGAGYRGLLIGTALLGHGGGAGWLGQLRELAVTA